MPKIIVEESEQLDLKMLETLARFFNRLDDPFQMPTLMAEIIDRSHTGVDTFYMTTIGYGHEAMSLRCTFKKRMLIMEFCAPDGMRLMELRLHA